MSFFKKTQTIVEEKTAKESKLFDQINSLWNKTHTPSTENTLESIYMVNRFISLDIQGFWAASELNSIKNLPEWCYAALMYVKLPYAERKFNKYPKSLVQKKTDVELKNIAVICNKYCCSMYHAEQIIKLLKMQGINTEVCNASKQKVG